MSTRCMTLAAAMVVTVLAVPLTSLAAEPAGAAAPGAVYHKQKVVYHMNDVTKIDGTLRNVSHHVDAVGRDNIDMVVVAHGDGIEFLVAGWKDAQGKSYEEEIAKLAAKGVTFEVCSNTLARKKVDKSAVNPHAIPVPSGVATLAELETQGYVYLKP